MQEGFEYAMSRVEFLSQCIVGVLHAGAPTVIVRLGEAKMLSVFSRAWREFVSTGLL